MPVNDTAPIISEEQLQEILCSHREWHNFARILHQSPAIYELEMARIWRQGWLFAGFTIELPKPGDFITLQMDNAPILIVRDDDGKVGAFHNVCRHRGTTLCREPSGNRSRIVCPYHQWTYGRNGELLRCHGMHKDLDKRELGLKALHTEVLEGMIFVSLADQPPAFEPARQLMAPFAKPLGFDSNCKIAKIIDYEIDANWKLVFENNRECYHCNVGHPQYIKANYDIYEEGYIGDSVRKQLEASVARSEKSWSEAGLTAAHTEGGLAHFPDPVNDIWYSANRTVLSDGFQTESMDGARVVTQLLGDYQDADVGVVRLRTMPNFWGHASCDHAVLTRLLPGGHKKTLARSYWLVHQDAVEGVDYHLDKLLPFWQLTAEQDWELCKRAQDGVDSPAYQPGPLSKDREYNVNALVMWYMLQMKKTRTDDKASGFKKCSVTAA